MVPRSGQGMLESARLASSTSLGPLPNLFQHRQSVMNICHHYITHTNNNNTKIDMTCMIPLSDCSPVDWSLTSSHLQVAETWTSYLMNDIVQNANNGYKSFVIQHTCISKNKQVSKIAHDTCVLHMTHVQDTWHMCLAHDTCVLHMNYHQHMLIHVLSGGSTQPKIQ